MISDPIIIAIVGACGVIAAALINNWRKHHPESQPTAKAISDAPSHPLQPQRTVLPTPLPRPVLIPSVERTFIGLRVQWSGQLDSISHRRDGSLCVYVSLSDRAFCETRPGILERVGRYEAQLRECIISKSNGSA